MINTKLLRYIQFKMFVLFLFSLQTGRTTLLLEIVSKISPPNTSKIPEKHWNAVTKHMELRHPKNNAVLGFTSEIMLFDCTECMPPLSLRECLMILDSNTSYRINFMTRLKAKCSLWHWKLLTQKIDCLFYKVPLLADLKSLEFKGRREREEKQPCNMIFHCSQMLQEDVLPIFRGMQLLYYPLPDLLALRGKLPWH